MPRINPNACRVCSCTEDHACAGGCSWVEVERGSRPLCSACSGAPGDVVQTLKRLREHIKSRDLVQAETIIKALERRVTLRERAAAA